MTRATGIELLVLSALLKQRAELELQLVKIRADRKRREQEKIFRLANPYPEGRLNSMRRAA